MTEAPVPATSSARLPWPEALALVGCVMLVQLPQAGGEPNAIPWLVGSMAPLWLAAIWSLARFRSGRLARIGQAVAAQPWLGFSLLGFVFLQLLAFYRGGIAGATPIGAPVIVETALLLGLVFFFRRGDQTRLNHVSGLLLAGLWLFVAVNVLAYAAGLRAPTEIYIDGEFPGSRLFRVIGAEIPVVLFPFASGVNAFGGVIGGAWASAWIYLQYRLGGVPRIVSLVLVSIAGLALTFLVDSRGAILFAGLTILAMAFWRRIRNWLPLAPLAALVLPLVLVVGIRLMPASFIDNLRLGDPRTVYALSGRTDIWRVTLDGLAARPAADAFGYGYAGHLLSGLSSEYAYVLKRPAVKAFQGPHNLDLQMILDVGLIGAGLFLGASFLAMKRLVRAVGTSPTGPTLAMLGLFVYMFLIGSLERIPTVYSQEFFVIYLLTVLWLLASTPPDGPAVGVTQ